MPGPPQPRRFGAREAAKASRTGSDSGEASPPNKTPSPPRFGAAARERRKGSGSDSRLRSAGPGRTGSTNSLHNNESLTSQIGASAAFGSDAEHCDWLEATQQCGDFRCEPRTIAAMRLFGKLGGQIAAMQSSPFSADSSSRDRARQCPPQWEPVLRKKSRRSSGEGNEARKRF